MKYCCNCGEPIFDDAMFCENCGKHNVAETSTTELHANSNSSATDDNPLINQLNSLVGNDKPIKLNWKLLFTDVTKPHTTEDAEEIFICGTRKTTPSVNEVSKDWPHPWLYSRVFLMFAIAFALLWICCCIFQNTNALPGLIIVGSFTVPLSTLILFFELNAWRNVSLYEVSKMFLVGGCASLVATLFLFTFFGVHELDFYGAFMTSCIEEAGKVVIVYYFLKIMEKTSILSGLLIGAAVGSGFAAFESAGYAMNFLLRGGWEVMMNVIFLRGFLTPGGHVVWAAISGAGLVIATKAKGKVSIDLFFESKFMRLFIIPIVLHGLWDSPLANIGSELYLIPIGLTVLAWIIVLILINMGLSEVSDVINVETDVQQKVEKEANKVKTKSE